MSQCVVKTITSNTEANRMFFSLLSSSFAIMVLRFQYEKVRRDVSFAGVRFPKSPAKFAVMCH